MNERQPYEKHLADKFQQLPVPDVEPNWQRMKSLLEKEMPRGGGYWRWGTGLAILLFMLGGTWFFIDQKDAGKMAQSVKEKPALTVPTTSGNSPGNSVSADDQQKPGTTASDNAQKQTGDEPLNQSSNPNTIDKNLPKLSDNNSNGSAPNTAKQSTSPTTTRTTVDNSNTYPQKNVPRGNTTRQPTSGPLRLNRELESANRTGDGMQVLQKPGSRNRSNLITDDFVVKNIPISFQPGNTSSNITVDKLAGDSIKNDYSEIFPDPLPVEQLSKAAAKARRAKMSAIDAVQDRVVAVGLSLPMGFPLGDQSPGAYNINARPNRVSDFIPAPHLQYHVNNKVYLQTELQFMNPQFIQPVLLFQNKTEFPSTNTVQYNSVYARKLYYFNVPFAVHYSPFPHFYLGTGLQFSSLISGVAMHEQTSSIVGSAQQTMMSQRYAKFRNDSISNRIDNSEFRLMLDANYYWRQFTVGLRYNQALSNYVSFRLNNVSPLFTDKNKSLQFYLRYNLWEDYKRSRKQSVVRKQVGTR